ncbi:ribonucleoside-diphosphate reductase subunit alpha [Candidatus Gracilibacteria bacterium]|nr:ribonucleoside-diphosphate reductase subunit alpha [Candidatus Gracilibacteria bacterium]MCF7819499.1 ribonucleoside-diphosphate reductase subunit alpha [Candidatus Gracilibacteria bacterium]
MPLAKIRKRSGQIVDFDKIRIETAVQKATTASKIKVDDFFPQSITNDVVLHLQDQFDGIEEIPSVEQIQDTVEQKLVESGNFEIAKRYILYRAEHEKLRAEQRLDHLKKLEKKLLHVQKSNGKSEVFQVGKIKKAIDRVAERYPNVDIKLILEDIKKNVFDGISSRDISKTLVMSAKSFIERDPEYSFFAAGLLLEVIYREVFSEKFNEKNFDSLYRASFKRNLERGVEAGRINKELLTFDFEKINAALKLDRDHLFAYLGLQTLYDRYFIHINDIRIEAPQHFWMRVAMGLALAEKKSEREKRAIEFYEMLSQLRFVNSTPTLFNSGTTHSQLSSCYLSTVKDNLRHIFKVIGDNAQLSKWAGGIGNDWTHIRATGARIHGTNGRSQGVIPFLKIANDTAVAVNQGGKRKGAVVAYLECWHFDFEEFLELRRNTGDERRRTHDMNTAAWIPDLFMKRVLNNEQWSLFSPDEVGELHDTYGKKFKTLYEKYEKMGTEGKLKIFKQVPAQQLWRKMVTMLYETGHPWMTFKDPCNLRSPQDHTGVVHNSNLCTEITLNNSEEETAVCNLGSINIGRHFDHKKKQIDKKMLEQTVKTAMRMLDNVIDINLYPTKETDTANARHRPVGLGIMGLQDYFYVSGINFDSDQAVEKSDEIMELISYHAILGSSQLASERGAYSSFKGSKWDRGILPIDTIDLLEKERGEKIESSREQTLDWKKVRESIKAHGMRNSNCMAIAPTATIANIAGCVPCTEPIYKNLYVKSNMGGEFTVINISLVEDLKKEGLWDQEMLTKLKSNDGSIQNIERVPQHLKDKYKEVFEISSQWIIHHAAARGKWIDQAQSTNIFYRGSSGKEISEIYQAAWRAGLKTTYYLRTLGATQIQKSTVDLKNQKISQHGKKDKDYSEAEKVVCSLLNGDQCDACQ